jgi:hypothetical protein
MPSQVDRVLRAKFSVLIDSIFQPEALCTMHGIIQILEKEQFAA